MKTIIIPAVAALAIALSTGAAFASGSNSSHDDGFDVFLQSQGKAAGAHREFLSSEATYPIGTDNGWAAYQEDQKVPVRRSFLSGSDATDPDAGLSYNAVQDREFRRVQGQ